ncbi:unnamed protein product [Pleuronectes platessa]|uniref:Uncharacterized protein n=1 Tax=Pleuronectes platessa TaxID=8262 RepID=A0A9N7U2L6_PLEPL|nr:unnamed protein product [Pleuronectes platessa]
MRPGPDPTDWHGLVRGKEKKGGREGGKERREGGEEQSEEARSGRQIRCHMWPSSSRHQSQHVAPAHDFICWLQWFPVLQWGKPTQTSPLLGGGGGGVDERLVNVIHAGINRQAWLPGRQEGRRIAAVITQSPELRATNLVTV